MFDTMPYTDVGDSVFDADFDFSIFDDDDVVASTTGDDSTLSENDIEFQSTGELIDGANLRKITVKKSAKDSDVGSKLRRKAYRARGPIDHNAAINSVLYRKDSRRKVSASGGFKLYAFPSFDRSDALLFLPTTFAGYFNSADSPAISKLMFSHVTKSCAVNVNVLADENINTKSFLRFHEVMSEVFPDIIMCVTATKVVENQIRANMVMKFTACKPVYESVGRSLTGTVFEQMFGSCRTASIRRSLTREEIPEEERLRFFEIADTDLDLVLHTRCEMILTVDDLTKKVTHLTIVGRLTSMEAVANDSAVCEQ